MKDVEYQIALDGFAGETGRTVLSWNLVLTAESVPGIVYGPTNSLVQLNREVALGVTTSGVNLRYQWFHDAAAIPGATGSAYSLSNAQATDAGDYVVEVMNGTGTRTNRSAAARLEVYELREGTKPPVSMGQDKLEDAGSGIAAKTVQRESFRWQVIRPMGLPVSSGYSSMPIYGNNINATTGIDENKGDQGKRLISSHSVWYTITNQNAGWWTISTEGSDFDTLLEVWRGENKAGNLVASDDNGGADAKTSIVSFWASTGVVYPVSLSGVGSSQGRYKIHFLYEPEVPQSNRQWASHVEGGVSFQLRVPRNMAFRVESSHDLLQWDGVVSTRTDSGIYTLPAKQYQQLDRQFFRAMLLMDDESGQEINNGAKGE
jgi:hypothetical protein